MQGEIYEDVCFINVYDNFNLFWGLAIAQFRLDETAPKFCENWGFKGIVHPKMKILSLITHPHVVPNP